ncbi:pentatricopeptide repeat-containing protein At1g11290, chloroplastic-like [Argentina anserina]|uniref:pentatricopeptide repeat-containing protein At1g11290, chloroplastic-like n=1 Tax=Argentina anserina TaxID=57926 RepID=UPI0021761FF5|nr:pentatricopeptide repeat-containing protein At1g11290, chloroplastic-like [Potentilla anserina]XP_050371786.1 pentatricopeptide repeat-containing protein At1g11290, chloroplastic-like [Potentilla anserina]
MTLSHELSQLVPSSLFSGSSSPTPQTLTKILSFCAASASLHLGTAVHAVIIKLGLSNVYTTSALVDMYGKCGHLRNAHNVFDESPHRNVVTWNSLISAYLQSGSPLRASRWFLNMLRYGEEPPTTFSFSSVLVCCAQMEAEELGAQVHGLSLKMGVCDDVVVGTGLIDMYAKCCKVGEARRVFDQTRERNVVTWTSMVKGCAQGGLSGEAMSLVREMVRLGMKPNHVTYNSLLSSFPSWNSCRQVHCRIVKEGFSSNVYIVVTLLTVYSEFNCSLEDFCALCACVAVWCQISWNAVIAGFCNIGSSDEARKCFSEMREAGVAVDCFTFTSMLKAVGTILALVEGKKIHALIFKSGQESNLCVQNGLVSMYGRCGAIHDAKWAFTLMKEYDVVSWNSLLSGYAHHGFGKETVELFEQMRRTEVKPDDTTFLIVLTACSHVGLLDKGLEYFNLMSHDDLLNPPKMEHYATVTDLFGRAGNLLEAEAFVSSMPIEPGASVYKALLSACQVHGNEELAFRYAKKLQQLCPNDPATYILLSNVLLTSGSWDDAAGVRKLMYDRGIRKTPGYSWI